VAKCRVPPKARLLLLLLLPVVPRLFYVSVLRFDTFHDVDQ
jgi:hypothetical protein